MARRRPLRFTLFIEGELVFDTLYDMAGQVILMVVIFFALVLRVATKHPNASGGIARGIFSLFLRK